MMDSNGVKKGDPQELVDQGVGFVRENELERAMDCFDQAIALDGEHAQAWFCKATVLAGTGDLRGAITCYASSVKYADGPQAAIPLYNMGNAFQQLGYPDRALQCFNMVTELNPEMADAWVNRGRILDDQNEPEQAIACYDRALSLNPNDVVAWSNRGNSLRGLGRHQDALESYERALKINDEDPAALIGSGICLGQLDLPEQGLAFLDRGLEKVDHAPSMAERATLLSMLGRHEEALQWIDRSMEAGGENRECWSNRGEVLARLGKFEDAVSSFDRALQLDPTFTPAWFGKARALFNQGQKSEARRSISKYFELADENDYLREAAQALADLCNMS